MEFGKAGILNFTATLCLGSASEFFNRIGGEEVMAYNHYRTMRLRLNLVNDLAVR